MIAVLRERNVFLLWLAGLISIAGDWMLAVALPIAVYDLTGSATAISGVVIAGVLPSVALSSIAGVFVDRWDRQRTMVVANLARAPALLLLLFVHAADDVWLIYLVTLTNSTFSQFFKPAENALLPQLVEAKDLVTANALNGLNNNLAGLVGPALGGVVAATYGLGGVGVIDAASFLIAGCLIAAIVAPARAEEPAIARSLPSRRGVGEIWREVGQEWLAGLKVIPQSPTLTSLFIITIVIAMSNVGFSTLLAPFVAEALDGGATEIGWLLTGQAVGGVVGATVIGAWGTSQTPGWLFGWGLIGGGVLSVAFYLYPAFIGGIWLGILLMVIGGLPVSAANTSGATLLQVDTADAYRGRVFGALSMAMSVVTIVVSPLAGMAAEAIGVVTVLVGLSVTYVVAGVLTLRWFSDRDDSANTGTYIKPAPPFACEE